MNLRDFFTTNTWWGKFLGGFFGFLTGGPLGAFFGVLIGNFFDRGLSDHYSSPHLLYHAEKRKAVQKAFFEATFSVMGHIAKADGRVSEQDIKMAQHIMSQMRLTREQKALAKQLFNEGKEISFKLNIALSQLAEACRDNRDLLKLFIDMQYRAAQVDGLNTKKINTLNAIFVKLGFSPLHQQHRFYEGFNPGSHHDKSQYHANHNSHYQSQDHTLDKAYALLEITPQATKQEAKRAYRRLMSQNHPDKLMANGLPEEMIKIANDKTQKILKAYDLIRQSKGWK